MEQLLLDIVPDPPPAFANFVPGSNGEALDAVLRCLDAKAGERQVHLWGPAGCGRTHLLRAAAVQCPLAAFVACDAATALPAGLAGRDVVLLDDVHRLGPEAQEALFVLFNRLRERGAALLTTGPLPPARLGLRPDVATRLAWGLVFQLAPLTDAEKSAALHRRAEDRGIELTGEAVTYMLNHWRRDMPSLMALLDSVDRQSIASRRSITLPLLRAALAGRPDSGLEAS